MLFIFSAPVLIRHLWQLKTVVFLHQCLIRVVLLVQVFRLAKIPPYSNICQQCRNIDSGSLEVVPYPQSTRGRIFSCVQPFYEQAVSDLDSSVHRVLWVQVAHSLFIEGSHMIKNMVSGCIFTKLSLGSYKSSLNSKINIL